MVAATEYLVDIAVGIDGSVGVRRLAVLLEYKPRFGGGTRRGTVGMACQLGENAPHGAGLQGYDNFGARLAAHAVDHGQIAIQQRLVEDVAREKAASRSQSSKCFQLDSIPRPLRPETVLPGTAETLKTMQK